MSGAVWADVADALRGIAAEAGSPVRRFRVITAEPLVLDQIDGDEVLDAGDDDVAWADALRKHIKASPLAVGDVLMAFEDAAAELWTFFDVESDREFEPPDPPDPPGDSPDHRHVQAIPAAVWVITWPTARVVPPSVTTIVDGYQVYGDVTYDEALKRATVTFDAPCTGVAYLT